MFLGREVALPVDLMFPSTDQGKASATCPQAYVEWVCNVLQQAHAFARTKLKASASVQKRLYDRRTKLRVLEPGTWVWRFYPPYNRPKLGSAWRGPYLVLGRLGQTIYEIQETEWTRPVRIHIDQLKVCEFSPEQEPTAWNSNNCQDSDQQQLWSGSDETDLPVPEVDDESLREGNSSIGDPPVESPRRSMREKTTPSRLQYL